MLAVVVVKFNFLLLKLLSTYEVVARALVPPADRANPTHNKFVPVADKTLAVAF